MFRPIQTSSAIQPGQASKESVPEVRLKGSVPSQEEVDGAITRFGEGVKSTGSKLAKKVVPIWDSLKGDHLFVSDRDYRELLGKTFDFLQNTYKTEAQGDEKKQLEGLLGLAKIFYIKQNTSIRSGAQRYYKERVKLFETILREEGVEKVKEVKGKEFDPGEMKKWGEKEVDKEEVDRVMKVVMPGFKRGKEVLKEPEVVVGVPKLIYSIGGWG